MDTWNARAIARWTEGLRFSATAPSGTPVELRGGDDPGLQPKELLLVGLCGCTGMDVASILQKMRAPYETLEVWADAKISDEHPKIYTDIRVTYRVAAPVETKEKLERAVELSWTRYCGVTAMLSQAARMTYQIDFNGTLAPVKG